MAVQGLNMLLLVFSGLFCAFSMAHDDDAHTVTPGSWSNPVFNHNPYPTFGPWPPATSTPRVTGPSKPTPPWRSSNLLSSPALPTTLYSTTPQCYNVSSASSSDCGCDPPSLSSPNAIPPSASTAVTTSISVLTTTTTTVSATYTYPSPTSSASPLADALVAAGCSNFLNWLQSDASTWELFTSQQLTVFAPSDEFFQYDGSAIPKRETRAETQAKNQASNAISTYGDPSHDQPAPSNNASSTSTIVPRTTSDINFEELPKGQIVLTTNNDSNTYPNATVLVVNDQNSTDTSSQTTRRMRPRGWQTSVVVTSGLGNTVDITKADVVYNNGLIQVTDG